MSKNNSYQILDSGYFRKLENIAGYRVVRPCPQAVWPPSLSKKDWQKVDDVYLRSNKGGGQWQRQSLPEEWQMDFSGLKMKVKATNFGHIGLFPEHAEEWQWLRDICKENSQKTDFNTLNLFAYTGGSSLAMAQGGAQVTHVDAAKGIVDWARDNAKLNNIDNVRWIVEDVQKFLQREIRRERKYQGIVLDPPTYGKGAKNELWKIEEDIIPLLEAVKDVLADDAKFVLFSCHTPHFTPKTLENLLASVFKGKKFDLESGEMCAPQDAGVASLPVGFYCKITFK